jgi:hypothetical protein
MISPRLLIAALLPLSFGLLACTTTLPKADGARFGPYFKPSNFQGVSALPSDLRRVVVLPIADSGRSMEENMAPLDAAVVKALSLAARFECVHLTRDDCSRLTLSRVIRSVDVLPYDFFEKLSANTAADAVLFIDLTNYSPYPPLSIGVRARLVRLSDRSVLWAIDQTFATNDPMVENSARHYWLNQNGANAPADMSLAVLQSPSRFAEYVMSASFQTLPLRQKP